MSSNNVVAFPRKKRQSRHERKGWREIFPEAAVRQFDDFKPLIPPKHLPSKSRIEYMECFIVIHGLAASVLIDDENNVIGGNNILRRARRTKTYNICVFVVSLKNPADKWALAEAYKNVNQKRGGVR